MSRGSMRRNRERSHADLSLAVSARREEFLEGLLGSGGPFLFLVLDCVQDPHNLGACMRTADAAGAHAVIVPKDNSAPLTETVRRVASGAAEHLPLVQVTNLARALDMLHDRDVTVVGADDSADKPLYGADLTGSLAMVLGAEGEGLRRLTREKCDLLVRIPMGGHVGCLNVSVATGVCLFEAVRQRGRPGRGE